jgi:hypothetical protein
MLATKRSLLAVVSLISVYWLASDVSGFDEDFKIKDINGFLKSDKG